MKLKKLSPASMMRSSSLTSIRSQAFFILSVIRMSAGLGFGLPEGWLCRMMTALALFINAHYYGTR